MIQNKRCAMWMPPDQGLDYARKLERTQREEAYQRQGRTGRTSYFLRQMHLGIGQKLLLLAVALVAIIVVLMVVSALTSPPANS